MRARVGLGLAGVLVAAAIGAGIAWATIPDAGGVIHGCYKKKSGALRVIEDTALCNAKSEQSLQWNQTGPQGPKGDQSYSFSTVEAVATLTATPANKDNLVASVQCPTGSYATGGGSYIQAHVTPYYHLRYSRPAAFGPPGDPPRGWEVAYAYNGNFIDETDIQITAYAVCATASS